MPKIPGLAKPLRRQAYTTTKRTVIDDPFGVDDGNGVRSLFRPGKNRDGNIWIHEARFAN